MIEWGNILWDRIADIPANASVLAHLRQRANPIRPGALGPSNVLGGYELHSHPDIIDVLLEAAQGSAAVPVTAYGYAGLASLGGVLFALIRGNYGIDLRLPHAQQARQPGDPMLLADEDLGAEWVAINPFYSEAHVRAGQRRLSAWIDRARNAATQRTP